MQPRDLMLYVIEHHDKGWASYDAAFAAHPNFAMARVADRGDIYPIFRELFQRRSASEGLR